MSLTVYWGKMPITLIFLGRSACGRTHDAWQRSIKSWKGLAFMQLLDSKVIRSNMTSF